MKTTPKSDRALQQFDTFVRRVRERFETGKLTYGDASFDRPAAEIIEEMKQEALDLAGWGFILFCRLEDLEKAASAQ